MSIISYPRTFSSKSVIWRYMDFSKYVDLLDSRRLFFSRLDILREQDPYEGSFIPLFFTSRKRDKSAKRKLRKFDGTFPKDVYVSCWYLGNSESAALWELFPKSDEGIAVRSTVERLHNSLSLGASGLQIICRRIVYGHDKIRAKKSDKSQFTGDDAIFTKRQCFKHEKELRLAIYRYGLSNPLPRKCMRVETDLNIMISEIIISPEAPCWIAGLVERVTKKYGFSFKIRQSNLNKLVL